MGRHPHRDTLIWLTLCVWSAAGIIGISRSKFSARSAQFSIQLVTKPATIRLSWDNELYEGGAYVDTPVKIPLKPGRHRLKIARDGYVAHVVTVDGDSGETLRMDDVVLVRNANTAFASVQVTADDGPFNFDIDDGLIHGETPSTSADLTADQSHQLVVYPKWPSKDAKVKCRFTVNADDGDKPLKLKIKTKNGKLKISGCDNGKAKRSH